jgi:hypothetical protein
MRWGSVQKEVVGSRETIWAGHVRQSPGLGLSFSPKFFVPAISVPISRIITTPAALTATIAVMVMDLHSLLLLLKVGRQSRRKLLSLVPSPREQLDGRGRGEVGQKEEEEREEEEEGRKNRGRT